MGIVGAGLAGLVCGDELRCNGITATLYEASARTGGRCFSLRGFFPGQVAERGGEFIDNLHKTMLRYARRFNLQREDVTRQPGDVFYFFDGQHWPESVVVDEFRDFVAAMHVDLRTISGDVTADAHTDADVRLDRTNLLEYLEGANGAGLVAGPVVKKAIIQAYTPSTASRRSSRVVSTFCCSSTRTSGPNLLRLAYSATSVGTSSTATIGLLLA